MNCCAIVAVVVALAADSILAQATQSATDLALDVYDTCLKDFNTNCVKPKAMHWFKVAVKQNEILLTDQLSLVRTGGVVTNEQRSLQPEERIFENIENFLNNHALRIRAPEYFQSAEGRSLLPDFLMNSPLTNGAIIPLTDASSSESEF